MNKIHIWRKISKRQTLSLVIPLLFLSMTITAVLAATPHPTTSSEIEARSSIIAPKKEMMAPSIDAEYASRNGLNVLNDARNFSFNQVVTATSESGNPSLEDQNDGEILPPEDEATEQLNYPEPIERPVEDAAYPWPQFQPTISDIQPFGTGPLEEPSRPIESIGGSFDDLQSADGDVIQSASSTIFLWLGFIVALMIFITGVYGSIVLFTRQRSSGE